MHFDLKFFLNQSITLLYSIIIFQVNLFKYYSFILNLSFFIQISLNFYLIHQDFLLIQTKFKKYLLIDDLFFTTFFNSYLLIFIIQFIIFHIVILNHLLFIIPKKLPQIILLFLSNFNLLILLFSLSNPYNFIFFIKSYFHYLYILILFLFIFNFYIYNWKVLY